MCVQDNSTPTHRASRSSTEVNCEYDLIRLLFKLNKKSFLTGKLYFWWQIHTADMSIP